MAVDIINMMSCDLVLKEVMGERIRQIDEEGFTPEHDDVHNAGELSGAGAAYALYASNMIHPLYQGVTFADGEIPSGWLWDTRRFKPKEPRQTLIKAAALLVAEIERLDRNS